MNASEITAGMTITNGSSAIRINRRIERDPRWGTPSWEGISISLEEFGGMNGMKTTVPDYLLDSWRPLPFEWTPVIGGALEERYVWSPDWRWLQREVRRAPNASPRRPAASEAGLRGKATSPEAAILEAARDAEDLLDGMTGRYSSGVCELPACGCSGEAHP